MFVSHISDTNKLAHARGESQEKHELLVVLSVNVCFDLLVIRVCSSVMDLCIWFTLKYSILKRYLVAVTEMRWLLYEKYRCEISNLVFLVKTLVIFTDIYIYMIRLLEPRTRFFPCGLFDYNENPNLFFQKKILNSSSPSSIGSSRVAMLAKSSHKWPCLVTHQPNLATRGRIWERDHGFSHAVVWATRPDVANDYWTWLTVAKSG